MTLEYIVWFFVLILLALIAIKVFVSVPTHYTLTGKVTYVVDGDTFYISGHKPSIRLWGVNAPEKHHKGFIPATATLKRLALNRQVSCQVITTDKYKRTVARCFLSADREINRLMIESGTATEYRRYSKGFYS